MEPKKTPIRRILSWAQIEQDCAALIKKIEPPVRIILPVSRGGFVPATIIAYARKMPIEHMVLPFGGVTMSSERPDILIVDDICDTGKTFDALRVRFPRAKYAALYAKPEGTPRCTYFVTEVPQHVWLVFPWAPADEINR